LRCLPRLSAVLLLLRAAVLAGATVGLLSLRPTELSGLSGLSVGLLVLLRPAELSRLRLLRSTELLRRLVLRTGSAPRVGRTGGRRATGRSVRGLLPELAGLSLRLSAERLLLLPRLSVLSGLSVLRLGSIALLAGLAELARLLARLSVGLLVLLRSAVLRSLSWLSAVLLLPLLRCPVRLVLLPELLLLSIRLLRSRLPELRSLSLPLGLSTVRLLSLLRSLTAELRSLPVRLLPRLTGRLSVLRLSGLSLLLSAELRLSSVPRLPGLAELARLPLLLRRLPELRLSGLPLLLRSAELRTLRRCARLLTSGGTPRKPRRLRFRPGLLQRRRTLVVLEGRDGPLGGRSLHGLLLRAAGFGP